MNGPERGGGGGASCRSGPESGETKRFKATLIP